VTLVWDAEKEVHVLNFSDVRIVRGNTHRRFFTTLCGKEIKFQQQKIVWFVDYSRCPECTRL